MNRIIWTKSVPATHTSGRKIRVRSSCGRQVTIGWPHESGDPHLYAAIVMATKLGGPMVDVVRNDGNDGATFVVTLEV